MASDIDRPSDMLTFDMLTSDILTFDMLTDHKKCRIIAHAGKTWLYDALSGEAQLAQLACTKTLTTLLSDF